MVERLEERRRRRRLRERTKERTKDGRGVRVVLLRRRREVERERDLTDEERQELGELFVRPESYGSRKRKVQGSVSQGRKDQREKGKKRTAFVVFERLLEDDKDLEPEPAVGLCLGDESFERLGDVVQSGRHVGRHNRLELLEETLQQVVEGDAPRDEVVSLACNKRLPISKKEPVERKGESSTHSRRLTAQSRPSRTRERRRVGSWPRSS